ncbi:GTPase ObgE [Fusibacillus kribbianus]|uniref:GTPase Obg n=1 Tax=Fusibacillus kribbianus TaxID=3044208 RepID=A0AAP4BDL0_9FIRM|nr:GTPase ObgE [Ruminococcus sp. YH-rum2234]MDI9243228.1 GTPase ObgE [Ruminococcus sp. YH-rum2234]
MFADSAKIFIKSGKGGDGHVSFRRELYVPNGGPDGGDGGRGGDIIFEVDKGLNTLTDFRHVRKYAATNGEEGGKRRCHGKDGQDLIIRVPEGTVIKDFETGKVIADMSGEHTREIILKGGRGGNGNMHYATATMQVPKYAQPGQDGQELWVLLELKVIADVGLVGFPNVGKSTLLSRVSNARPKIANYHFTTINPNLGVVDLDGHASFVMADIPGLIEGASEGIGLGHAFLKHIERTKVLIHMVDAASTEGRDPVEDIKAINTELEKYNPELLKRPQVIAANKIDAIYADGDDPVGRIRDAFEKDGIKVFAISAVSGQGVKELLYHVYSLLKDMDDAPVIFEREFDPADLIVNTTLPYTVEKIEDGLYSVEGPRIEKMLGYTNIDSEKGFEFFQNFLKTSGILEDLEKAGIEEGDTVKMYGLEFDYYK